MTEHSRPISPHLTAYRFTLTMTLSIVHRITGIGLYLGTALLAWWLVAAAIGDSALDMVNLIFGHWLGQIVLFGYTWALFHHMCGGIRHFIWDTGAGFEHNGREGLAWFTLIGGLVLTLLVWTFGVWL
jgi:succinate dehydrogenase / fumarate reductase cytochrome b subunit